jgi:plastocyanin
MLRYLSYCFLFLTAWNPLSAATVTVTAGAGGNFFSPAYFVINPGDTVQWVWKDGHHNTSSYSMPAGVSGWYGNLNSSDTQYLYVPSVSGLYQYTCTHHSAMDGSFLVRGCSYPGQPVVNGSWENSPCAGTSAIVLRTAPQPGATYQWLRGATLIPGASADSLRTAVPGSYTVLVNRCGVDSLSLPYTVAAYPLPAPSFSYSASGLHYTFTNTTASPAAYLFRWHFGDGSPVVTGIHTEHTFSKSGIYQVQLFISDSTESCSDSTTQAVDRALDISNTAKDSLTIHPNPTAASIDIRGTGAGSVQLYDLYGNMILAPSTVATEHQLDVAGLPAGPYLLLFRTAQGNTFTKRIIVY